jgi:DNA polymerase V
MNSYPKSLPTAYFLSEPPVQWEIPEKENTRGIPCYADLIKAGFPSPAADYREEILDFNAYLVQNPASTFTVRVEGDSMIDEGIRSGDLLIVDRSIPPGDGMVIVAILYGEFTVKKLVRKGGRLWLYPGNPAFDPVRIELEMEFQVWGVVSHVIHRFLAGRSALS